MLTRETPILDLSYLNEATGGDSHFIEELLKEFQSELKGLYHELTQALSTQEKEELIRFAHTIKGASANLGAQRIRLLAAQLEVMARAEEFEQLKSASPLLGQEIAALQSATAEADIKQLLKTGQTL